MSKSEQHVEKSIPAEIELTPDHRKKIAQLLSERPDRFLDARDFVGRAIDVFLTWERTPAKATAKMAEMEPTLDQFALMSQMLQPEELGRMYPGYPKNFGSRWKEFLKSNSLVIPTKIKESEKQHDARKSENDFEGMQENILESCEFIKKVGAFDNISVEGFDEISFDGWPLLFTHYSRLFPAKIGILTLADMMREQKSPVIDLNEFKIKAYDIAEEVSAKMMIFEKENKKTRDEKKSTGLPKPYLSEEMTSAQAITEQRYKDRYFGKMVKNIKTGEIHFEGLLMALGLIRVFAREREVRVTLTENGKKFCLFENPVFKGKMDVSLSKDECEFLSTKCIPQRLLELKMIKNAINIVRETDFGKTKDMTDDLDNVCYDAVLEFIKSNNSKKFGAKIKTDIIDRTDKINTENKIIEKKISHAGDNPDEIRRLKSMIRQTPISACRIATMGRMSELGIVVWNINENGRSEYTITDHKLVESIMNL